MFSGSPFKAVSIDGTIWPDWPIDVPIPQLEMDWFAMGDLNGDGADDVVFLSNASNGLVYALGGDGHFLPNWPVALDMPSGSRIRDWYSSGKVDPVVVIKISRSRL